MRNKGVRSAPTSSQRTDKRAGAAVPHVVLDAFSQDAAHVLRNLSAAQALDALCQSIDPWLRSVCTRARAEDPSRVRWFGAICIPTIQRRQWPICMGQVETPVHKPVLVYLTWKPVHWGGINLDPSKEWGWVSGTMGRVLGPKDEPILPVERWEAWGEKDGSIVMADQGKGSRRGPWNGTFSAADKHLW